ncbi:hypothetical protein KC345_g109 [Hortaea werneckii]|nr:hypothetical protein KC345_g109 [Hortaea werneckii]
MHLRPGNAAEELMALDFFGAVGTSFGVAILSGAQTNLLVSQDALEKVDHHVTWRRDHRIPSLDLPAKDSIHIGLDVRRAGSMTDICTMHNGRFASIFIKFALERRDAL